ncbi:hypothetical protein ABH935_008591 [Catenulispora sp. GAS73]|uniref:hypothetical protein n=1 Tax=Catenulispora sp. GAS73 TaxID=3156269 RepID=UPI003512E765
MTTPSWPLPATVTVSALGTLGGTISAATAQSRGIHTLDNHPGWLAKFYQKPLVPGDAKQLDGLVAAPRALSPTEQSVLLSSSSWPAARITAPDGSTLGCVIPTAPDQFKATLSAGRSTDTRFVEVDWLARDDEAIRRVGLPVPKPDDRLQAVTTLVALAAVLDRLDLVYSDWSYSNAFWSPVHRQLYVIDIDGCQSGKAPNLHQPNWDDPRTPSTTPADKYTDRYRVALLAARCLTGMRDADALRALPSLGGKYSQPALTEVLMDCLLSNDRERRPATTQLHSVLTGGFYVRPMPSPVRIPLPPAPPPKAVRPVVPPAGTTTTINPHHPAMPASNQQTRNPYTTGGSGKTQRPSDAIVGVLIVIAVVIVLIAVGASH